MSKKSNDDILSNTARSVRFATNLLAKLWRLILDEIGMDLHQWNKLMEKHLDDPIEKIPNTSAARSSARGNLNRELKENDITWKVFEKGIRFLRPLRAEFRVKLHWQNGSVTEHAITLINQRMDQTDPNSHPTSPDEQI